MLKKLTGIAILMYFSLGSLLLPMANFTLLPQLPQMYQECKTHEHPDMNAWEFITDHLVNIDGVFDAHEEGDEQEPHHPTQNEKFFQQTNFNIPVSVVFQQTITSASIYWRPFIENYEGSFVTLVFHPPTV